MIHAGEMTEDELHRRLDEVGYEQLEHGTETSTFWRNKLKGWIIQVPNSIGGKYPNWLLEKIKPVQNH